MMETTDPYWKARKIVEVVCIVEDSAKPSYRIGGVRQEAGDRCRLSFRDAEDLVRRGKAQIVDESKDDRVEPLVVLQRAEVL